jgi:hypothetical protein
MSSRCAATASETALLHRLLQALGELISRSVSVEGLVDDESPHEHG